MEAEQPTLLARVQAAARSLEERGYAVIESLFTEQECTQLTNNMWTLLEGASNGDLTRDLDYATVKASRLPSHKHGILECYGLNHAEFVRRVRRDPRVLEVFALLYGTDQLTGSMDRVNWKFPGRAYHSQGDWCHADQHPRQPDRIAVQSYLTVTAQREESPGNRFYEGSHAIFSEFFADQRDDERPSSDWTRLTDDQRTALRAKCPLVKPQCPVGSLVLWDSRTVHSPSEGTDFADGRFAIYLCYSPLWGKAACDSTLKGKQEAFTQRRATAHCPVPQTLFGKTPRVYDLSQPPVLMEIPPHLLGNAENPTQTERYLFGFRQYYKQEGCLLGEEWKQTKRQPLLKFADPFFLRRRTSERKIPGEKHRVTKKAKRHQPSVLYNK